MPDALPEAYIDYLEQRIAERIAAVSAFVASLTARERALIKDVAVMGYVQGRHHPKGEPHPEDGRVLTNVIDACLSMPDLYPAINPPQDEAEDEAEETTEEPNR